MGEVSIVADEEDLRGGLVLVNGIDRACSFMDRNLLDIGRNFGQIAAGLEHFTAELHLEIIPDVAKPGLAQSNSEHVPVLIVAETGYRKRTTKVILSDRHTCELHKLVRIGIVIHSELLEYLITNAVRSESTDVGVSELVYDWDPGPIRSRTNAGYINALVWLVSCFNHMSSISCLVSFDYYCWN